ncbi:unnamed protein product [Mytilus coruscus]|uniref:B box-type domain-containing protein n=1 Tax=Mytilus coruscus TaxID=42192 RepID=A0A6J8CFT8_MYTCO|nr:unnamed protein product [Mytilus coruscus]
MAFSKSIQKVQAPMSCQMCEESSEIKWKCLQCNFFLCTKCQKLHLKVKSTDKHAIIDIKEIAFYQKQAKDSVDFDNIPCEIHNGQNCCLFCLTCEEVVCPLCIATTHNKHNMIQLDEGYKLTINEVKTLNSELEELLLDNVKRLSKVDSLKSSEDSKYESEKQKILSQDQVLKNEVDHHTKKLLKDLEDRWETLKLSLKEEEDRSQKINKDIELRNKKLYQALHSNNANEVFNTFKEEKRTTQLRTKTVNPTFKRLPQYVPQKIPFLVSQHGELIDPEDENSQDDFVFKVIQQYKTELNFVENLVCCDHGMLWIDYGKGKTLQKVQPNKESINVITNLNIEISDMALLPYGGLLLCTKEPELKIFQKRTSEVEETKYSVAPLISISVHVSVGNKIIVGARNKGERAFPISGPRKVIVMDLDGKKEKVYHLDSKRKPRFSVPRRITSDNDDYIYVIDILSEEDWKGRIVALNSSNGVRWVYKGHPDMKKEQIFQPNDLVSTKSNNIIVTDDQNHMFHILNKGQCIRYLKAEEFGINLPSSLDIGIEGLLYIGCGTHEEEPAEAKIFTVQFSGF